MNLDRRLIKQARQAASALMLTIALGIGAGALVLLQARQLSAMIARVFLGGQTLRQVVPLLIALAVIALLRAAVTLFSEVSANLAAVRVKENLREMLFTHIQSLGPGYTQGIRSAELTTTVVEGIEALDAYFSQYLPQLALAAAIPLVILAAVFPIDLLSAVVLLITAPLIPVFMMLIGNAAVSLTRKQFTTLNRMSAFFLDTLQGLATLKSLGQSQRQTSRIAQVSQHYRAATMRVLRVTFLSALALELIATLSTAVIAVQIGIRLLYGQVDFEQAFFILVIAPEFYLPLRVLGLRFHAGMSGVTAARRIFAILDEQTAETNTAREKHFPTLILSDPYCLSFENVSFSYPGRQAEALHNVSFELKDGQQVALVGQSGSGKSTIASLLMRFITPQQGCISLNGRPIDEISPEAWREQIAWMPQQPYLLHNSIAANLRIAKKDASESEILDAASAAGLDEVLSGLPQGLNTIIGEGGARLSGGEAQRLALARAFLRNAPLLVLDEPTSHLDPALEAQLQEILKHLSKGRTVLTIAHSLPTVLRADRIVVLETGRVVESGQHSELVRTGGVYSRLVSAYEGLK